MVNMYFVIVLFVALLIGVSALITVLTNKVADYLVEKGLGRWKLVLFSASMTLLLGSWLFLLTHVREISNLLLGI